MSNPAAARVTKLAMDRLGCDTPMELAHQLGIARTNFDRDRGRPVIDWAAGKYGPKFEHTMLLLSRAGLLTEEAVRAYWGAGGQAKKEIEAALAALADAAPVDSERRSQDGRGRGA